MCFRTCVCGVSDVLSIAGADEELDLGKQGLKIRDVWHGKLHKPAIQLKDTAFFQMAIKDFMNCVWINKSLTYKTAKTPREWSWMSNAPRTVSRWERFLARSSPLLLISSHSWVIWPENTALWMKTWFHISLIQIYTQSRSHIAFNNNNRPFLLKTTYTWHRNLELCCYCGI